MFVRGFTREEGEIVQITAIKQGQMLIFSEMLDIPDGQRVTVEITEVENNGDRGYFGEDLEEFRRKHNIAELDLDIDAIFGDVRDKSPGREVNVWD
jgi:hypothetical protein